MFSLFRSGDIGINTLRSYTKYYGNYSNDSFRIIMSSASGSFRDFIGLWRGFLYYYKVIVYRLTGLIHISNKQRISLNIQFVGFKSDLEFFKKNQTGGESLSKQYHISFRLPDYAKKKIFVVLRASIYGTSYLVNRFRFHLKGSSFSNQSNGILRNEKNPQRWNNRKLNHDSPENHTIFP